MKILLPAFLSLFALAASTAAPATPDAGQADVLAVEQALAKLDSIFTPGWWTGSFSELDENGKVLDVDDSPSCILADGANSPGAAMAGAFLDVAESGDCAVLSNTVAGGQVNVAFSCTQGGRTLGFAMKGTSGPHAVDVKMTLNRVEDGVRKDAWSRLAITRVRACTPQEETREKAALATDPEAGVEEAQ